MEVEPVNIQVDKHLNIRSWKFGDEAGLAAQADHPDISENIRDIFPHPYTIEDAEKWIAFAITEIPQQNFAIELDNEIVGAMGMRFKSDVYRKNIEIGYWLGVDHWNKGITTKCLQTFIKWIFHQHKIHRVFASVFETNKASMKVLEKVGFVKEAVLKEAIFKLGHYMDEHVYALLDRNWPPQRESQEAL